MRKKYKAEDDGSIRIRVALTATTFMDLNVNDNEDANSIINANIPLCSAKSGIGLFGYKERMEHFFAETVKKMAKEVKIDAEKKQVIIGCGKDSLLVEYTDTDEVQNKYSKEFF